MVTPKRRLIPRLYVDGRFRHCSSKDQIFKGLARFYVGGF
jgi:hypothetical protein